MRVWVWLLCVVTIVTGAMLAVMSDTIWKNVPHWGSTAQQQKVQSAPWQLVPGQLAAVWNGAGGVPLTDPGIFGTNATTQRPVTTPPIPAGTNASQILFLEKGPTYEFFADVPAANTFHMLIYPLTNNVVTRVVGTVKDSSTGSISLNMIGNNISFNGSSELWEVPAGYQTAQRWHAVTLVRVDHPTNDGQSILKGYLNGHPVTATINLLAPTMLFEIQNLAGSDAVPFWLSAVAAYREPQTDAQVATWVASALQGVPSPDVTLTVSVSIPPVPFKITLPSTNPGWFYHSLTDGVTVNSSTGEFTGPPLTTELIYQVEARSLIQTQTWQVTLSPGTVSNAPEGVLQLQVPASPHRFWLFLGASLVAVPVVTLSTVFSNNETSRRGKLRKNYVK
jgi:hypothetical protein